MFKIVYFYKILHNFSPLCKCHLLVTIVVSFCLTGELVLTAMTHLVVAIKSKKGRYEKCTPLIYNNIVLLPDILHAVEI